MVRTLVSALLCGVLCALLCASATAQTWNKRGVVTTAPTFDAVPGPDGYAHLLADRYLRIDAAGQVVLAEPVGARAAATEWAFAPAIHVAGDSSVHIAVRSSGGLGGGYQCTYRRRSPTGGWGTSVNFNTVHKWNFLVGVGTSGVTHQAYTMGSGTGADVWRPIHFFRIGATASDQGHLGSAATNSVYRVDNEAIMRAHGGTIFFAAGNNNAPVTYAWGDGTAASFSANKRQHTRGSGDKAFPNLYVDKKGDVHLVYGSGFTKHPATYPSCPSCIEGQLHYAKYAGGKTLAVNDKTLFTGLGYYHISVGLGAVAASDDGAIVLAVALQSNSANKEASQSKILWSVSKDGGATFSAPADTGYVTNAVEGRLRPKLVAIGRTFVMFYWDNSAPHKVSLAALAFPPAPPAAPAELVATATSPTLVKLTWRAAVSGETVLERKVAGGSWKEITRIQGASHDDATVSPKTDYRYRAKTVANNLASPWTAEVSVKTPPVAESDAGVDAAAPMDASASDGATDAQKPTDATGADASKDAPDRNLEGTCSLGGGVGSLAGPLLFVVLVWRRRRQR